MFFFSEEKYILEKPEAFDKKDIENRVYSAVKNHAGSVSAEHGIGIEKKDWLSVSRTPAEIALMQTLKRSLDPRNILNPGKVISIDS